MKHVSRSLHSWIAKNVHITCALSSMLSIYLVTYGSLTSQSAMVSVMRHSIDAQTAQGITLTPHEKKQVAFVASIIETASPSRKDSDTLASLIVTESKRAKIDPLFVTAVIQAESSFKPKAVSHKGAQGLMQLMPSTARELGVRNSFEPEDNIWGGVKYLSQLLQRLGNESLAIAAYNAGEGPVRKYNGIPPYSETQTYVKRVLRLKKQYSLRGHG